MLPSKYKPPLASRTSSALSYFHHRLLRCLPETLVSFTLRKFAISSFSVETGPALEPPTKTHDGDQTLVLALAALEAGDYIHAFSLVSESLNLGISWRQGQAEALNLRGTFKFVGLPFRQICCSSFARVRFLIGDVAGAKQDLLQSVDLVPSFTQSLVKMASVCMEMDDPAQAFECFDKAIKYNANDPDIYYHRGQGLRKS
jgi:import receptor subunit TOM70